MQKFQFLDVEFSCDGQVMTALLFSLTIFGYVELLILDNKTFIILRSELDQRNSNHYAAATDIMI